jgi:hypothetical protein
MGINSYYPAKGIVEAAIGDSIRFEVDAPGKENVIYVSATPAAIDTSNVDDPPVINGKEKAVCQYTIAGNASEWLYVICNGETILRYKLNIKKSDSRTAKLSQ